MKLNAVYPILTRLLVYVYGIHAFSFIWADTDLWGHLKFGQDIWQQGFLPKTDPYSYTVPGHPWINHEWLSEWLYYGIYSVAGSTGLLVFNLTVGLVIWHLLSRLYFAKAQNLWAYVLYFLLLTHVFQQGYSTRPHLLTLLFTTVLVTLLHGYFDGHRRRIFWVPSLMLLWVNCHGGVAAGLSLFGLVTVVETLRRRFQKEPAPVLLLAALGLSGLAVLINPYGIDLWLFLIRTIPQERVITEWEPVPLFRLSLIHFKILALLCVAALVTRKDKRPWEVAVILFSLFFAFRHLRHTLVAGILMTPFVPVAMADWMERLRGRGVAVSRRGRAAAVAVLCGLILWQGALHFRHYARAGFQIQVDPADYPVYAVRFMRENGITGNVLVKFDWGEYLIWKLPGAKVSADGRYWTVYPNRVVIQNLVFHQGWPGWQYLLDFYPHEVILTDHTNRGLESRKDWVKVYQDGMARVFVKNTDPPGPVLRRFKNRELILREDPPSLVFP